MVRCLLLSLPLSLRTFRTTSSSSTVPTSETPHYSRFLKLPAPADLVEAAPPTLKPYLQLMRLHTPTGSWLLYWPCTWSIALATPAGQLPSLYYLLLFGAGSVLMRGAGCVVNDILDKEYDKRVERTKMRPLACGTLNQRQAISFLAVLLSSSLAILLQFNWFSVAVGASSLIAIVIYPLAKRYTYWPQFVLGATLNWGVLIAWAEMLPMDQFYTVLPLYCSTILHTVIYDTIYSHQLEHPYYPYLAILSYPAPRAAVQNSVLDNFRCVDATIPLEPVSIHLFRQSTSYFLLVVNSLMVISPNPFPEPFLAVYFSRHHESEFTTVCLVPS
ncbi:unnamed protein product [Cylicostephanus goldi]|uniref:4-hydroxybenzoate polyprenyltransferase n=1 Tax=Cylicostephanus goldi TaxID=71465 RepID=A0A3P6QJZ1_CYLGO|nr:unnamed protein product [Cylicostephanus goldi]